jgi:hypothetical protein
MLQLQVHGWFALWLLLTSVKSHSTHDILARLSTLGLLDLPNCELLLPGLMQLPDMFSADSKIDAQKLCFFSLPLRDSPP